MIAKGRPRKPNASLRYDGATKYLWVYSINHEIGMDGKKAQSRWTQRFYARSFRSGPFIIKGRCASMKDQQRLANFIRNHQLFMVEQTGKLGVNSSTLMRFNLPTEDIYLRGYVPTFTIHKKGHFAPAPEFEIQFQIISDRHSTDPLPSYTVTNLTQAIRNAIPATEDPDEVFDPSRQEEGERP